MVGAHAASNFLEKKEALLSVVSSGANTKFEASMSRHFQQCDLLFQRDGYLLMSQFCFLDGCKFSPQVSLCWMPMAIISL
jgi:hypothetical protein